MALPTSALVYGPKDVQGYWSHYNVGLIESTANTYGAIVENVDPRVFEQWCNNVWDASVSQTINITYSGVSPSNPPPESYSATRVFRRLPPFSSVPWNDDYPPPSYVFGTFEIPDGYELRMPLYDNIGDPTPFPMTYIDASFYVRDGKLMCAILPPSGFSGLDELTSYSLSPETISISGRKKYDYLGGIAIETSTITATIIRRFYEPAT